MSLSTTPANDTAAITLTIGTTYQAGAWRVQRWTGRIEVTALENAGRRGKACTVLSLDTPGTSETALDAAAPVVLAAVVDGVHVETMRAILMAEAASGLAFCAIEKRGVDVPKHPELRVIAAMVSGFFGETEFNLSFSFWIGGKVGGLKHDYSVCSVKRADAAKAYVWASNAANMARLPTMTRAAFMSEMGAIGVRVS